MISVSDGTAAREMVAVIRGPRTSPERVEALVGGEAVWFAADVALELPMDAIVAAFLFPVWTRGGTLVLDGAVSEPLRSNLPHVATLLREWWGARGPFPIEPASEKPPRSGGLAPTRRGTGLMFSGGVDSFYSLLRGTVAPDALVFVDGFDIPLADVARRDAAYAAVREVADALGVRAIRVATNIRDHALFRSVSWDLTHGGAMAAVGHTLRTHLSHLVVSSSDAYADDKGGYGSHFRLDPLWSSDRLAILFEGATHRRSEKLLAIAGEPLVRRHLRVCWEHRAAALNCGHCEKCIRTQLTLLAHDQLQHFATFRGTVADVTSAVRALAKVSNPFTLRVEYESLALDRFPRELADAIRALRGRSWAAHARRQHGRLSLRYIARRLMTLRDSARP
ncbi:MAG: hypothetical protein P3B76_11795 [Gemmatimonadota bacterium]|nr:hypothetical protein [Gemmatimonadota bacterium]